MAVKLLDVARLAGVSTATVSRVLTQSPSVRPEVRERVLSAMRTLHYRPSHIARSLRTRRSRIIALAISDILNPFFHAIVRAVEDVAYDNEYALFLCNTDENATREAFYVDVAQAEHVAGLIISPSCERDAPCRRLIEAGTPVVVFDRRLADIDVDTVTIDNVRSTRELVGHLLDDGHRRVGAILGDPVVTTGRERLEGYIGALREHGLAFEPQLVRTGMPREPVGYAHMMDLLDSTDRPTGVFTGNNLLTVGALKAIRDRGLRVPEDIALVGFDDIAWMSLAGPGVTVAAQPTYELGRAAIDLLLRRIQDPTRPVEHIRLSAEILVRQSCARHPVTTDVPATHAVTHHLAMAEPHTTAHTGGHREGGW